MDNSVEIQEIRSMVKSVTAKVMGDGIPSEFRMSMQDDSAMAVVCDPGLPFTVVFADHDDIDDEGNYSPSHISVAQSSQLRFLRDCISAYLEAESMTARQGGKP